MNPQDPTSTPAPALDPDERALAERLARIGPHGEPSPALDSRILSAAHAAVRQRAAGRPARRKPRVRWSVGLGIAASLVLAIGLAWQLRPLPDAAPAYRSEADSATRGAMRMEDAARAPGENKQAAIPTLTAEKPAGADRDATAPQPRAVPTAAAPEQAPVVVADAPARGPQTPAPSPAPPPPAPPAPPAPSSDASVPAAKALAPVAAAAPPRQADATGATTDETRAATGQSPGAVQPQAFKSQATGDPRASGAPAQRARGNRPSSDALSRDTVSNAVTSSAVASDDAMSDAGDEDDDMPYQDVPPATAASPVVRDAWLARIRELRNDGRLDEARASLHEFGLRYPGYPLPADLRALGRATPPPAPPGDAPVR